MKYGIKCNAHDGELKKCFVACGRYGKTATVAARGAAVEVAVKCWRGPHILSAVLSRTNPTPTILFQNYAKDQACISSLPVMLQNSRTKYEIILGVFIIKYWNLSGKKLYCFDVC